jgi:hypothetical protein
VQAAELAFKQKNKPSDTTVVGAHIISYANNSPANHYKPSPYSLLLNIIVGLINCACFATAVILKALQSSYFPRLLADSPYCAHLPSDSINFLGSSRPLHELAAFPKYMKLLHPDERLPGS